MNPIIERELGQVLTVEQVSEYLHVNPVTVRRHYETLGGIKVGKCFRFFEKRLIDAVLRQGKGLVDRPGTPERKEVQKAVSHQGPGQKVGNRVSANSRPGAVDVHNLLA